MNFLKSLSFLTIGAVTVPILFSCSSDEPKGADDANKSVIDFDGLRLTSVNNYWIQYDNKGRVVEVGGRYDDLEIDYSSGTFELENEEGKISFNGNGYITEISLSWNEKEDGYVDKGNGSVKFSYDSNGHLVSIKTSAEGTEKDPYGDTEKWESNYTSSLKWKNNNLISTTQTGWEKEDGEKENYEGELFISYSSDINEFNQFPLSIASYVLDSDDLISILAAVGLFGKGSALLPDQMEVVDGSYTETYNINFDINRNGSIDEEYFGRYESYSYSYSLINTKSCSELNDKKLSFRKLFVKKHNNK